MMASFEFANFIDVKYINAPSVCWYGLGVLLQTRWQRPNRIELMEVVALRVLGIRPEKGSEAYVAKQVYFQSDEELRLLLVQGASSRIRQIMFRNSGQ